MTDTGKGRNKRIITVIVPVENDAELERFFDFNGKSVLINKKIEWIFAGEFDKEGRKGLERDNVKCLFSNEKESRTSLFERALNQACGDYINISHPFVRFEPFYFTRVLKAISENGEYELIASDSKRDKEQKKRNIINYRLKTKIISYRNDDVSILIFPQSFFLRKTVVDRIDRSMFCDAEYELMLVISAMRLNKKLLFLPLTMLFHSIKIGRLPKRCFRASEKSFYSEALRNYYLPMLQEYAEKNNSVPIWVQRIVYYQLFVKYRNNFNASDKQLLIGEELEEFLELSRSLLQFIDDRLIMGAIPLKHEKPAISLRNLFEWIKYDGADESLKRSFYIKDGKVHYSQCGISLRQKSLQLVNVNAMTRRDGMLVIDASYGLSLFHEMYPDAIRAVVNGVEQDVEGNGVYSLSKVFGEPINKKYTFQVKVPEQTIREKDTIIEFIAKIGDERVKFGLLFPKVQSKINVRCEYSRYRIFDDKCVVYENNAIVIRRFTDQEYMEYEKGFLKEIRSRIKNRESRRMLIDLRRQYMRSADELKKTRRWIYFDKLYKAGDNGEYQFRYAMDHKSDDGIEHYYVLKKDAEEWDSLNREYPGHILEFGSQQCRLYGLTAENIVATHPDIVRFIGFNDKQASYVKDLFNPNLICIAHGVTIQKNADYQNRLYDNTMFYTTSSKYEIKHLLHPIYGYDESELALTGMARFDGLVNRDKRQILITPTWRRSLAGATGEDGKKMHSDEFKKSSYYKIYDSLINDERIIRTAKETGYRVIFLLHPLMSSQIEDYHRNDYVDIIPASGNMSYEKILTESSLMVTDYSGIHYDFGYMRKPVIYYQPKEVPMRFEEGGMKFKTMGFGPVCYEYEEAVALICEYMKNECRMPEQFKRNADDFFAFDDHNNCERIYNAISEWTRKRQENKN